MYIYIYNYFLVAAAKHVFSLQRAPAKRTVHVQDLWHPCRERKVMNVHCISLALFSNFHITELENRSQCPWQNDLRNRFESQRSENNTDFQQRWVDRQIAQLDMSSYDICACRHLESLLTPDCLGIVLQCWWPEVRMNCCPFHSFEGFDMTWGAQKEAQHERK